MNDIPFLALKSILQPVRTRLDTSLCPAWLRTNATILVIVLDEHVVSGAPRQCDTIGTPLLQREFSWMKAIETCTHGTNLEFLDVFQGMHLWTCGEVLPLGGSDTCDHVWTSPRSYVQRRLLQHFPDHPLLGLSIVLLSLVCLCWMTANERI